MRTGTFFALFLLATCAAAADPIGWAVGAGSSLKSTNGGVTWSIPSPTTAGLNATYFTDELYGWSVGASGRVLRTTDGGGNWFSQTPASRELLGVFFLDRNHGWVVGAGGIVMRTTNGGLTWSTNYPTTRTLRSVWFVSSLVGMAAGDQGTILRTVDGGLTWQSALTTTTTQSFYSVFLQSASTVWVVGTGGSIFRSTDGGDHWWSWYITEATLKSVRFVNGDLGFVVGTMGTVIRTVNGGVTWAWRAWGNWGLNDVAVVNSTTAVAVSEGGTVLRTTDGGNWWWASTTPTSSALRSLCFVEPIPIPPTITQHPSNVTVLVGQAATFTVSAIGSAPFAYQWQKNGATVSGAVNSSYTTPPVTQSNNGSTYRCVVSNPYGAAISNEAVLTVTSPGVAPTITQHPANATIAAGQAAAFTIAATGTMPLAYQWQKNGTAIGGAVSSFYTTPAVTQSDNGSTYRCMVSNAYGSAISNQAVLTVTSPGAAPTITQHPANATVSAGQTATFTVVATGTAPIAYQWQKNGAAISGAVNSSYTTPSVTQSDNGSTYRCIVSNTHGMAVSNQAVLTVTSGVGNLIQNPGFESGTAPWSFFTNGAGSFTTESPGAVGTKAAKVTVTALGSNVNLKQSGRTFLSGSQYRLSFKAKSSSGRDMTVGVQKNVPPYICYGLMGHRVNLTTGWADYTVLFNANGFSGAVTDGRLMFWFASDAANGESYYIDEVVLEEVTSPIPGVPLVTTQPVSQTVVLAQRATFSVTATGTSPLSYQWQKNGMDIAGATLASYQTPVATVGDNGAEYRCQVKNTRGVASSNHAVLTVTSSNLIVNPGFELGTANWILSQSGGGAATFTTITPGYAGAKAAKVTVTTLGRNINLKQTGFPLVAGGQYRLTFRAKSSTGRDMTVGVQKNVSPYTCYGLMGHRVNLTTTWTNYTVLFNTNGFTGTVTDVRFMFWFSTDAVNGESYHIDEVKLERLTMPVAGVPKVTTQPVSRTVAVGQRATFSVTATGASPLAYQWQKNGKDIGGATSASYVTLAVTLADNGVEYRCQVKNSLGAASSNHAVLTVANALAKDGEARDKLFPDCFCLSQNYPNPFNPSTTIAFSLPEATPVVLRVYDLLGREVGILVDGTLGAGEHSIVFEASHLASGAYLYRLQAGQFIETRRMVVMK